MGGGDGCEGRGGLSPLSGLIRAFVNSVDQGNCTFARETNQPGKSQGNTETSGCDNHVTTYNLHVYLSIPPLLRSLLTVGFFYIS